MYNTTGYNYSTGTTMSKMTVVDFNADDAFSTYIKFTNSQRFNFVICSSMGSMIYHGDNRPKILAFSQKTIV